jgi:hypothetical protein
VAQLDPEVPLGLRFVAPRQHPGPEHAHLLASGVDASRLGLEQERQEHVHRRGLARPVDAAQQQAPTAELDGFVAVLVDVDDPGAVEHPPLCHAAMVRGDCDGVRGSPS